MKTSTEIEIHYEILCKFIVIYIVVILVFMFIIEEKNNLLNNLINLHSSKSKLTQ